MSMNGKQEGDSKMNDLQQYRSGKDELIRQLIKRIENHELTKEEATRILTQYDADNFPEYKPEYKQVR
jgi:hypothetical protein